MNEVFGEAGKDVPMQCGGRDAAEKIWYLVHHDKDNEKILHWKGDSGIAYIGWYDL